MNRIYIIATPRTQRFQPDKDLRKIFMVEAEGRAVDTCAAVVKLMGQRVSLRWETHCDHPDLSGLTVDYLSPERVQEVLAS